MTRLPGPFPLACTKRLLEADEFARVVRPFDAPLPWVRHQDHFYRCFIAEVDGLLPRALLVRLRRYVARVLDLDLVGPVRVTVQRMEAGDGSDRHTDRPLAGYEAARLILQLDRSVGGHFRAFDGDRLWLDLPPRVNAAVAFELSALSEHDVTPCTGTRRTVVFHFWHVANQIHARAALDTQFRDVSFAELPSALEPTMLAAEAVHDDGETHRAACVATLLHRWAHPEAALVRAYRRAIAGEPARPDDALARFLVQLHVEGFDRRTWEALPPAARRRWLVMQAAAAHGPPQVRGP